MEAMAAGIPVIATNVGGTKELVSESVGALIEANLSSMNLKGAISKIQALSSDERKIIGNNAFVVYNEKVNFEKNCLVFLNFLKDLL
jgi:glycosyltransferase involved in cell wall biosynthesis